MMYKKNNNDINKGNKRPRIKIKDFYKIYEKREINENNKSSKRNELTENRNKNINKNVYNNNNFNSFSDNNNSNINKSVPKLNNDINDNRENINEDNLNDNKNNNNDYFVDLNSKNSNQSYNSKNIKIYMNNNFSNNNILNSSNQGIISNEKNSKNEVYNKNNYDYNGDNCIFTRITPNFANKSNEEFGNDSSIPYLDQNQYNSKINKKNNSYMNKKKLNNSNNIYVRNKSPYGRYIYHNKKRIINIINNNEVNFPESYSQKNDNSYENNIEDSPRIYRTQRANEIDDKKKIYFLIKNGIKIHLDENEKNDYMDLLTIEEFNNLDKIQSKKLAGKTILPIQDNQTNNLNQLSSESNNIRNDDKEINDNWQKRNNYFLEKQFDDNGQIKIIGKKRGNKKINKNRTNKSFDNIIFNRKTGLNKKRRNNRRNNSPDFIDEDARDKKGTPIKKENDKGGIVVLYPNYLKSQKTPEVNESSKNINFTIVYLQRWWKKIYYNYIKKIIIIQKIFKRYYYRKNNEIIYDTDNCYKIFKINNCFITKAYYKLPYNKANKFRDYSKWKNSNEYPLKSDRIAKEIVATPNSNLNGSQNDSSGKEKKNINNLNNNNIINNNACIGSNIEQSFQNKKHRYTGSKLTPISIDEILLNECKISYKADHYTFLKICQLRRPRFEKDDDEDDGESDRPLTCEIMRKVNTNLKSKNVTPDANRNKIIIANNSLEKINLLNIEFINEKKNRNNQKSLINNNGHKYYSKNNGKDNNRDSKTNHYNNYSIINIKYKNNKNGEKDDKNANINLTCNNYNYLNVNKNKINNNLNNTKNSNEINNGSSSYNNNSIDFDDINNQNLDNINTYKTIYCKKNSEDLINNDIDINKIRTISTVQNNTSNNISKNSQLNNNDNNINKNNIESHNDFQNNINKSNNSSKLENKDDDNYINEIKSKKSISNEDDKNNEKENEKLEKVILIQRNIRKFLQKIKQNKIKVKRTSLQSKKSIKKSKKLKKNDLQGTSSFNNSKYQLNNKKNSYKSNKSNKKVSFKDSAKGFENSLTNLEYSHSSEQNNAPDDDVNDLGRKNNDSDSLKSISINKDFLESIRNNGSSVNNSIFLKNSIYSINSIDNNIRKYLNNFNSNYDSYIDKSKANSIYEDNNYLISPNDKIGNRISKINSSSLKSVKYKYNKIYYEEYLKYLLKENYICFAVNQLKNMGMYYKYYKLMYILKMLEQRIIKVVHQFVFFIIKGGKNDNKTNIFFNVLKIYIKNINNIISENNDITKLLKDEIVYYSKVYQKYKYVPYIRPNDENKLIDCHLFNKDDEYNELIKYVCSYLNFEKQLNNISSELVKSYIIKNPLKNFNIFTITRYIDSLYDNISAFN